MSVFTTEHFDALFTKAHTEHGFLPQEVPQELLQQAVDMALLGPTAFNCLPMRIVFVKSAEGKEKLSACLMEGNRQQTAEAAVTAIICFDEEYQEQLPKTMPFVPGAKDYFPPGTDGHKGAMLRNGNLQAGYFIMALRALGLGCGPMSGFSNDAVDAAFLADTKWKSNFLINIGYPVVEKRYPRAPRLSFEEATKLA